MIKFETSDNGIITAELNGNLGDYICDACALMDKIVDKIKNKKDKQAFIKFVMTFLADRMEDKDVKI